MDEADSRWLGWSGRSDHQSVQVWDEEAKGSCGLNGKGLSRKMFR